jgi:phospholipase C
MLSRKEVTVDSSRRTFLKVLGSGVAAAAWPSNIERLLAMPAHSRTRTIGDVEHVIFLMQENRSFDHYFGTMRGVRGFNDPRAVNLPSGAPVWQQPTDAGFLMPYRVNNIGTRFLPDPPHGWNDTHAAWNEGRHDQWVANKGETALTYYTRTDLPYYYALADAFTVCDDYHCSVMGPTDPNRYHMWTGWVGNDGAAGGPVITNAEAGYDWSTYPERLQSAGISWKIYQDAGVGLDAAGVWGFTNDAFIGNFGDNSLLYFHQYQNALPGTPLADKAKTGTNLLASGRTHPEALLEIFRSDVMTGQLPQVSWIVAPEAYTEHPNWVPQFGEWYVSQFLDVLAANPDVWSKTVVFLTYDEEGGFFDHRVPPTPPQRRAQGLSTVTTVNEIFPGDPDHPSAPYGLGMRVPMIVISPWTKGGWVNSQVFDHTSLIRFIETRFAGNPNLVEANITPWRRAITGDLTSVFDFAHFDAGQVVLHDTDKDEPTDFKRHADQPPKPPTRQTMPSQETGVRPARPLPYTLHAHGHINTADGSFVIDFDNPGPAAAVFQVRAGESPVAPRTYTVEGGKSLSDFWSVVSIGASEYDLSVYGPNGFLRAFKGSIGIGGASLETRATYSEIANAIQLAITNRSGFVVSVTVNDMYTGDRSSQLVANGGTLTLQSALAETFGWYDFVITVDNDPVFENRFAGHLENGQNSFSDPLMGGLI